MRFDPAGDIGYQLGLLLDGGIEFGQHIRGGHVEVTLVGAETRVEHNLGYTPLATFYSGKTRKVMYGRPG